MKTSVLIPTYNSERTIEATLDSVFSQTIPSDEILVMDDGSTDKTVSLLSRHVPRITLLQQRNRGVAHARNILAGRARGDLIAFLDHDDLWHPKYIATQRKLFADHPRAVGFFTGHDNVFGHGHYEWEDSGPDDQKGVEVIAALEFLQRYHKANGPFASMSFFCVPKTIMCRLGQEPFCPEVSGVDDFYLFHSLILLGPIVFSPKPMVAYRITPGAQSASLLKLVQKAVRSLELLEPRFRGQSDLRLRRAFNAVFSSQRREYGRVLMGTSQRDQARKQLWLSMRHSYHPISLVKSLVLLFLTGVPNRFQPRWPSEWKASHSLPG